MKAIQAFLESMVTGLSRFAATVESTTARLFAAMLSFLEDIGQWLTRIARAIADYLRRFFAALGNVALALGKLSLFYVPSALCLVLGLTRGGYVWLVAAAIWALFVTGIGLAYWKKVQVPEKQSATA